MVYSVLDKCSTRMRKELLVSAPPKKTHIKEQPCRRKRVNEKYQKIFDIDSYRNTKKKIWTEDRMNNPKVI